MAASAISTSVNLISGARVNQDEYEKEGVGDFVLWKKWVEADGDVGWDSPWGRGRPGWHIECSTLSMEFLGPQIDVHGGGTDLRFPHHENEIAQSEAATGKTFVGHWFHVEHLLVDGQKMSKSLGNMYTVRDVMARGYTGRELRYALLYSAHYRTNLNFTWAGMENAKTALQRIDEWRARLDTAINSPNLNSIADDSVTSNLDALNEKTIDSNLAGDYEDSTDLRIHEGLNISNVLGLLFITIRASNKLMDEGRLSAIDAQKLKKRWSYLDSVLGLGDATVAVPIEVQALRRISARKPAKQKISPRVMSCGKPLRP